MTQNPALWQRLESFDLDDGAPFSFSKRLARDNGWTPEFALRVCTEYKKFLFLACVAGHPVTPSDEVDQAWHLHLTYSRSYWDELCARVLERPLHHDPTRGGKSEGDKFENWYARTLDSYLRIFESPPPRDIWPASSIRFSEAPHFRRVNLKRHFVISRPKFSRSNFKVAPALGLALILAGCSASGSLNPFDWYGSEFLTFFWSLCALFSLLYLGLRTQLSLPNDDKFPSTPPDPYILARLSDEGHLPVDAALCSLQSQGYIQTDANGIITPVPGIPAPDHPFERRVYDEVRFGNRLARVRRAVRGAFNSSDQELQSAGLLLGMEQKWNIYIAFLLLVTLLLAIGLTKIVIGLDRGRPVGFLVCSCILVLSFAIYAAIKNPPHRTRRGERYLRHLRESTSSTGLYDPTLGTAALVVGAALWGYGELEGYGFADFRRQPPSSSGGDGGSSSGGGGDGGCGGGGCGGCGS